MHDEISKAMLARSMAQFHSFGIVYLKQVLKKHAELRVHLDENIPTDPDMLFSLHPTWQEMTACIVGIQGMINAFKAAGKTHLKGTHLVNESVQLFENSMPDLKNIRDMLTHMDEYLHSEGRMQPDPSNLKPFHVSSSDGGKELIIGWTKQEYRIDFFELHESFLKVELVMQTFFKKNEIAYG
jgi:hypothetical protein